MGAFCQMWDRYRSQQHQQKLQTPRQLKHRPEVWSPISCSGYVLAFTMVSPHQLCFPASVTLARAAAIPRSMFDMPGASFSCNNFTADHSICSTYMSSQLLGAPTGSVCGLNVYLDTVLAYDGILICRSPKTSPSTSGSSASPSPSGLPPPLRHIHVYENACGAQQRRGCQLYTANTDSSGDGSRY